MKVTPKQVAQYCHQAGFRGEGLETIVAISGAETGGTYDTNLDSPPNHTSGPDNDSIDRGLFQLNSYWHAEISNDNAHLPGPSAQAAYRISKGGTNFTAWSTYNNGAYKKYLPEARRAVQSLGDATASLPPGGSPIRTLQPDTAPALGLVVGGQYATAELGYAVVGASVSFTTQEASQLSLAFEDNTFWTLGQYKFQAGPEGTPIDVVGQRWRVQTMGVRPGPKGPQTVLICQPSGVMRMRGFTPGRQRHVSPTNYVQTIATNVGLDFVGEQSATQPSVGPKHVKDPATGRKRLENAWEVARRSADQLNFLCFESGGTLFYASPKFLATVAHMWQASFRGNVHEPTSRYGDPIRITNWPTINATALYPDLPKRTLSCQLERENGQKVRGGDLMNLAGIPLLDQVPELEDVARLLAMTVTSVGWDLMTDWSDVSIEASDLTSIYDQYATPADRRASALVTGSKGGVGKTKSALDFVTLCLRQVGDKYVWGAGRDVSESDPEAFDCSGLIYWACAQVGVSVPSTSQTQWVFCRDRGTAISVAKAARTRGALLFEAGSDGTADAPGHVAISLGDGKHTIEARGRAYGVNEQLIEGRPWSHAALIPGMNYQ